MKRILGLAFLAVLTRGIAPAQIFTNATRLRNLPLCSPLPHTDAYALTWSDSNGCIGFAAGGGAVAWANLTSPPFVANAKTATYQVLQADFTQCKTIPVASGTFTITLVASGAQPTDGQCIQILNYGSGVVTVARSGQNINGGTAALTLAAGTAAAPTGARITSNGTDYFAQPFIAGAASGVSSLFALSGAVLMDACFSTSSNTVTFVPGCLTGLPTLAGPNSYTAGGSNFFRPNATTQGLRVECTTLPSTPDTGAIAHDATCTQYIWSGSAWLQASPSAAGFATLTDAATVTWAIGSVHDAGAILTFTVHSGSRTLNITNPVVNGNYVLKLIQDGTGGEGLTLGTGCTWKVINGGAGAVTPSTGAAAIDVLAFTYDGTNCLATFGKNYN